MNEKTAHVGLHQRYRDAVREFRLSYSLLAASDQKAGLHHFPPPINVVDLRHAIANPGESGSLHDDIARALK